MDSDIPFPYPFEIEAVQRRQLQQSSYQPVPKHKAVMNRTMNGPAISNAHSHQHLRSDTERTECMPGLYGRCCIERVTGGSDLVALSALGRRRLLRLLLLLHGRVRVAVRGGAVSYIWSVRDASCCGSVPTLRRWRVALLRRRVSAAVGHRRIHVGLVHTVSGALGRAAILRGAAIATAAVAAAAAVTTAAEASSAAAAGTVVRSLVDSNRSAVKPAGRNTDQHQAGMAHGCEPRASSETRSW